MGQIPYPDIEDVLKSTQALLRQQLPAVLADITTFRSDEDLALFGAPIELTPPLDEQYWLGEPALVQDFPFVVISGHSSTSMGRRAAKSATERYPKTHDVVIECYLVDDLDQKLALKIARYGLAIEQVLELHSCLPDLKAPIDEWGEQPELTHAGWVKSVQYDRSNGTDRLFGYVRVEATFETQPNLREF